MIIYMCWLMDFLLEQIRREFMEWLGGRLIHCVPGGRWTLRAWGGLGVPHIDRAASELWSHTVGSGYRASRNFEPLESHTKRFFNVCSSSTCVPWDDVLLVAWTVLDGFTRDRGRCYFDGLNLNCPMLLYTVLPRTFYSYIGRLHLWTVLLNDVSIYK